MALKCEFCGKSAALWERDQPRKQHAAAPVESKLEARARGGGRREEASPCLHGVHPRRQGKESGLSLQP